MNDNDLNVLKTPNSQNSFSTPDKPVSQVTTDRPARNLHWIPFWVGVAVAALFRLLGNIDDFALPEANSMFSITYEILLIILTVFSITYAAYFFPSIFTAKPKISSEKAIAFLNGLCGGLIFGLCWQFNLQKNVKGISNIVFIVIQAIAVIIWIIEWLHYNNMTF